MGCVTGRLVLGNFSEFALIVLVLGVSNGLITGKKLGILAVAVALSMVLSSLLNERGQSVADRLASRFRERSPQKINRRDKPIKTGDAQILVLGMGRVGVVAYDRLSDEYGAEVLGIENDHARVEELDEQGYSLIEGDATDFEFWDRVKAQNEVDLVVLAMPIHDSNWYVLDRLEEIGYTGKIAAIVQHKDQAEAFKARGVSAVFNLYEGAGRALGDVACDAHKEALRQKAEGEYSHEVTVQPATRPDEN